MPSPDDDRQVQHDAAIDHIRHALRTMRFGAINLTVHEGHLVQIDVTERQRFVAARPPKD